MARNVRTWNDYFIPGSSIVLNNELGETTEVGLKTKEEARSPIRIAELDAKPIKGAFD